MVTTWSLRLPTEQRPLHTAPAMPSPSDSICYDVLYYSASSLDIPLLFSCHLKSGDYTSIAATVNNDNGMGI